MSFQQRIFAMEFLIPTEFSLGNFQEGISTMEFWY